MLDGKEDKRMCGFGVGGRGRVVARKEYFSCACGQREIDTASSERFQTRNQQKRKKSEKSVVINSQRISTGARIRELVYKQNAETQIAPQRNDLQKKSRCVEF